MRATNGRPYITHYFSAFVGASIARPFSCFSIDVDREFYNSIFIIERSNTFTMPSPERSPFSGAAAFETPEICF